jgi:hypothetical protein
MHSILFVAIRSCVGSLQAPAVQFLRSASFAFRVSLFAFLLVGCGAPGDPVAPSPPVATTIADLAAHQAGDAVELTFTMPSKTIRGERLTETPAVEILRGALKSDGSPDAKSFHVVATIPGALMSSYQADDHTQIPEPIAPEENRAPSGVTRVYQVRTRASKKRASIASNAVVIRMFPVPQRISALQFKVNETSIDLNWSAPTRTSAGDPIAVSEYHIYRGQLDPRSHDPATTDVLHEKWIAPLALLDRSDTPAYRDTQFEFGKIYVYIVRSAAATSGGELESSNSDQLVLSPEDTFPPATPRDVIAATINNLDGVSTEIDLSWSISTESDLAGYRVYRSDRPDDRGQLLTSDLLLSPAYRDTSVSAGHHYLYRVTAVDRSGNESAPTPPVAADVTQHSS